MGLLFKSTGITSTGDLQSTCRHHIKNMLWITDQLRGSIKMREHLHFPVQNGVMWRNTWRFHTRLMTADHSWGRVNVGSLLHAFFLICPNDWHFSRGIIGAGGGAEMTSIIVLVSASNETLRGVKIDPCYLYRKYLRACPAWQFSSNFLTFQTQDDLDKGRQEGIKAQNNHPMCINPKQSRCFIFVP